jgi:hypothetical protein
LIPERAAVVKRIFALAAAGYGQKTTVRLLIREKVPAFGPAGHWNASYLGTMLKDRRAVGEFQPRRKRDRTPHGPPIPNYYPAAVTEAEWLAARAGAAQRFRKRGRVGHHLNVFAGLLKNARFGDSYYCAATAASERHGPSRVLLMNSAGREGRCKCYTFPFATFEPAMLSMLAEVDPREVLGREDGPDEVLALAGELAGVQAKKEEIEAELLNGDVAALAKVLRQLEERERDLSAKLAEVRQKAAVPLKDCWGEAKSLLEAIADAPDPTDAKLRLRSVLRQVIAEVWLLVVPRGSDRLCVAQVFFPQGDKVRHYIIYHRPPRANNWGRQEGRWTVRSFVDAGLKADALDLRKREHARRLEKALTRADLFSDPNDAVP